MEEPTSKIILVTGMSGIKIEASLKKFVSEHSEFRRSKKVKPKIIKLDTEIENVFYKENPNVKKSKQVWKDVILKKSYPVLQRLWDAAFESIVDKVETIKKERKTEIVFVNLHSCYYHNKTQEYVSLLDLNALAKLNPAMSITVIDDIYDVHHRLTEPGGIFHDETNATNTQMILRLIRLLDWRAKEMMISKFISKHLKINNYILAVKHSYDTLANLIYEELPKAYLSHPITEVRRLENMGKANDVAKIMSEITEISDRLTGLFTTFLPTSIDEYRIAKKTNLDGSRKDYYAILQERWESELYINPKSLLFIDSGFRDINELWKKNEAEINKINEQINHLLEALAEYISDQVTTRDYSLVEQSDILVIYRPVFNGNASGGVREEFRYYKRLKSDTKKDIQCFIYCPKEDIEKYYIRQFELKLLNEINFTNNLRCRESDFKNLTQNECLNLLKSVESKLLILDVFDEVLDNHNIEITIRNERTPLGGNSINEFKSNFADQLLKNYDSVLEYKSDTTYFEEDVISVESFVNNLVTYFKK